MQEENRVKKRFAGAEGLRPREVSHSEMASDGHSSMHAPQSTHLSASTTATSSMVIAPLGQASAQAPHPTHFPASIFTAIRVTR